MTAYCVFNVGDRRVGLPMAHVREIVEQAVVSPVPVPLAPDFVRGLFNLRGQVLPFLDLAPFVGAAGLGSRASDRAMVVERGDFRFAVSGERIDTLEVDPATFQPMTDAALFPALDAEASSERGNFQVIHLDRLEACLSQACKFSDFQ
jgi:purine-binding chemotaxis protein CheW